MNIINGLGMMFAFFGGYMARSLVFKIVARKLGIPKVKEADICEEH